MQNQVSFDQLVERVFNVTKDYFTGYILNLFNQQTIILVVLVIVVLILTIINIFILIKNISIYNKIYKPIINKKKLDTKNKQNINTSTSTNVKDSNLDKK